MCRRGATGTRPPGASVPALRPPLPLTPCRPAPFLPASQSLDSEVAVLKRIRHPNVVELLDISKRPDRLFLILEFCEAGDLSQLIRAKGVLPEKEALFYFRQLASGLRALREHDLMHRDLKPQNLLLALSGDSLQLKIADFGFVRELQSQNLAQTLCGSPLYMAPEILRYQQYDSSADLWSVGAILYEMVCGRPPYTGQNPRHLLENIERQAAQVPARLRAELSPACQDMILRLLRRNPRERISWGDFFAHPFLSGDEEPTPVPSGRSSPREEVGDAELQREIRDVAKQLDLAKLSRVARVKEERPSDKELLQHSEFVKRREGMGSRAGGGGEGNLLGGEYVLVDDDDDSGGRAESSGAPRGVSTPRSPREEARGGALEGTVAAAAGSGDGGARLGFMRTAMLHGLPGHLSEPSTLLRLPIKVEEGVEEQHLGARLHNLQCASGAVWECARDLAAESKWFESISLMMLGLSILEAAHSLAKGILQGGNENETTHDAELCHEASRVEPVLRVGMQIVVKTIDAVRERAAELRVPEPEMLPHAGGVLYQTAIQAGRGGAVAELMGDKREAAMRYVQAAGALQTLLEAGGSGGGGGPGAMEDDACNGIAIPPSPHSGSASRKSSTILRHSAGTPPGFNTLQASLQAPQGSGKPASSSLARESAPVLGISLDRADRGARCNNEAPMSPAEGLSSRPSSIVEADLPAYIKELRGMEFEPGQRSQLLHYVGVLVSRAMPLLQDVGVHESGVEATVLGGGLGGHAGADDAGGQM